MSRYTGRQHRGADRDTHDERRLDAQARDDVTPTGRRRPNPAPPEKDCE